MSVPVDAVPDGHVAAPHHLFIGLAVVALVVWVVSDDYAHREPLVAAVGVVLALVGFGLVWKWYPETGAAMSLAGVVLVFAGVLWPGGMWSGYSVGARAVAVLGALVAADDVVEHAFPIGTPLDWVFGRFIYPVIA